jgi:hypothetical protein
MITLVLVPADRLGRFWPYVDGRRLTKRSTRQPFYDGARALAAAGHHPETTLEARHQGNDIIAMRSTIGEAAKWRIEESDSDGLRRRPWSPYETGIHSRQVAPENSAGED